MAICNAISGDVKVGRVDGCAAVWDSANNMSMLAMTNASPNVFTFAEACATNGTAHGGFIDTDQGARMAAVWQGGALTTLHQPAWLISVVKGMNATTQVGYATTFDGLNYNDHAYVWTGTPAGTDLHQFLPAGYVSSNAYAIDAQGNIVGTANTASGEVHAFVWKQPSFTFSPFCAPINDPATPPTVVRKGAVLPLALKVFNSSGVPVNNVKVVLTLTQLGEGGGPINTDVFDTVFDIGPYFRFVGFGINRYMYLMSTKDLLRNKQYELTATVEGTNDSHSVVIGVR
jgi:probable HAF family extracellular repeat protein